MRSHQRHASGISQDFGREAVSDAQLHSAWINAAKTWCIFYLSCGRALRACFSDEHSTDQIDSNVSTDLLNHAVQSKTSNPSVLKPRIPRSFATKKVLG